VAIPSDYAYRAGFYWKQDGTGPYVWDGSSMTLYDWGVTADSVAAPVDGNLFNGDTTGPATAS
jgi:hypothetical protein